VEGIGEQPPLLIQQGKIHPPGVQPDGFDRAAGGCCGGMQPGFDLRPDTQDIPMQSIGQAHRDIGKSMRLRERQTFIRQGAQHRPAALCTQVECQIGVYAPHISLPRT
jgi:hypothetical protein